MLARLWQLSVGGAHGCAAAVCTDTKFDSVHSGRGPQVPLGQLWQRRGHLPTLPVSRRIGMRGDVRQLGNDVLNCGHCGHAGHRPTVLARVFAACPSTVPTVCNGVCRDIKSDRQLRGVRHSCPLRQACNGNGVCAALCVEGETACGSACTNLLSDESIAAPVATRRHRPTMLARSLQLSVGGAHGLQRCVHDIKSDRFNCGACGPQLPARTIVQRRGGSVKPRVAPAIRLARGCVSTCRPMSLPAANASTDVASANCARSACTCPRSHPTVCNGLCVDILLDPLNCGTCSHACNPGDSATDPALARSPVPLGQAECAESARPRNPMSPIAEAAKCLRCRSSLHERSLPIAYRIVPDLCDGLCTNVSLDPLNCGSCGKACPMGATWAQMAHCFCPALLPNICGTGLQIVCTDLLTDA